MTTFCAVREGVTMNPWSLLGGISRAILPISRRISSTSSTRPAAFVYRVAAWEVNNVDRSRWISNSPCANTPMTCEVCGSAGAARGSPAHAPPCSDRHVDPDPSPLDPPSGSASLSRTRISTKSRPCPTAARNTSLHDLTPSAPPILTHRWHISFFCALPHPLTKWSLRQSPDGSR